MCIRDRCVYVLDCILLCVTVFLVFCCMLSIVWLSSCNQAMLFDGFLIIKYFQLQSTNDDRTITRGNPYKLFVNYCRTNVRKNFFIERVVKVWNSLPPTVVNFSTLSSFRNSLHKINFRLYPKY